MKCYHPPQYIVLNNQVNSASVPVECQIFMHYRKGSLSEKLREGNLHSSVITDAQYDTKKDTLGAFASQRSRIGHKHAKEAPECINIQPQPPLGNSHNQPYAKYVWFGIHVDILWNGFRLDICFSKVFRYYKSPKSSMDCNMELGVKW